MKYVISDLHFNRNQVIKMDHRLFADVSEMNAVMVKNWNDVVGLKDEVYILGDFAYGTASEVNPIIAKLHGKNI